MKYVILSILIGLNSCTTKSVLRTENTADLDHVVQTCGGQIWGYRQRLKGLDYSAWSEKDYMDMLVLLSSDINDPTDELMFKIILKTNAPVDFEFNPSQIHMRADGKDVTIAVKDYSLFVEKKSIAQIYSSSKYHTERVAGEDNTWQVSRKIFGSLWTKDPFIVKIDEDYKAEVKNSHVIYAFNKETDQDAYINMTLSIPRVQFSPKSQFKLILPAMVFSKKNKIASKEYTFNYDEDSLRQADREPGKKRCVSARLMMLDLSPSYKYNPLRLLLMAPFEKTLSN